MAKLHARLDGLDPEPARRRAPTAALRDGLAALREWLSIRRIPALGLSVATAGAIALVILTQPAAVRQVPVNPPLPAVSQQVIEQQLAASANDPLADAAAEKLTVHADNGDGGSNTE
jgi:hypothetical protein